MASKLLHEDLTFVLRGILYDVHNELGRYRNEKQFCDLIEFKLKEKQMPYIREYVIPESFDGERKGRSRVDFFVDNKVFLEIKVLPSFSPEIYRQCKRYLVSSGIDLLLLVNFYYKTTAIERVLNPNLTKQSQSVAP